MRWRTSTLLGLWMIMSAAFWACAPQSVPSESKIASTRTVRFLALGDSYTVGAGVDEGDRWPVQLAGLLHDQGFNVAPPKILAQTGWTTGELLAAWDAEKPQPKFDIVFLLIGVNNQFRGLDLEDYRVEFGELASRSLSILGGDATRLVVLSIPDWGVSPMGASLGGDRISREVELFNEINRSETDHIGARYIDVTASSRRAASETGLIAEDGLHPSGQMYAEWAELVLPEVLEILQSIE